VSDWFSAGVGLVSRVQRSGVGVSARSMVRDLFYGTLNLLSEECSIKNGPLVVHFTHHKCGTTWFYNSLNKISQRFRLKFQPCNQEDLEDDTDIWMQWHSQVNFHTLRPYVGSHMIRDPRDVVVSAYFYHLWCDEQWCHIPRKECDGMGYQGYLNMLSKEDGLSFEMKSVLEDCHTTGCILRDLGAWDYTNPNLIELKYEDVIGNPRLWFGKVLEKYGFNERETELALKIVYRYSFEKRTKRRLGEEKRGSRMRKGTPGDWRNHFTERLKAEFKELYGDLLVGLGYEKDRNW
jgi:hypothetical protein